MTQNSVLNLRKGNCCNCSGLQSKCPSMCRGQLPTAVLKFILSMGYANVRPGSLWLWAPSVFTAVIERPSKKTLFPSFGDLMMQRTMRIKKNNKNEHRQRVPYLPSVKNLNAMFYILLWIIVQKCFIAQKRQKKKKTKI